MGSSERRSGAWMTAVIGLGLLAVAGVVVGGLVLLGVGTTSAVRSVVAGDRDVTTVVGGASWTAVRTSRDGRSLLVLLTGSAPYRAGNSCTSDLSGAVAGENDREVVVVISARSPRAERDTACPAVGYLRLVEVPLDRPRAGRTVVDADGAVHEVFDGTTLLDPVVPQGWTITSEGDGGVWPDALPSWTRTWSPSTEVADDLPPSPCVGGPSSLQVTQGATDVFDWTSTHGVRVGTADVHGREAVVMKGPFSDDLAVTWADGATGFAVSARLRCGGDVAMPLDDLLAYACSLA